MIYDTDRIKGKLDKAMDLSEPIKHSLKGEEMKTETITLKSFVISGVNEKGRKIKIKQEQLKDFVFEITIKDIPKDQRNKD